MTTQQSSLSNSAAGLREALPRLIGFVDAINARIATDHAMTRSQVLCLFELRHGPLASGELASRLHLTSGAVSHLLKKLDAIGATHRLVDPQDRRRVLVAAQPEIIDSISDSYAVLYNAFEAVANEIGADDIRAAHRFVDLLLRRLQ